jgi:hypothetical protein
MRRNIQVVLLALRKAQSLYGFILKWSAKAANSQTATDTCTCTRSTTYESTPGHCPTAAGTAPKDSHVALPHTGHVIGYRVPIKPGTLFSVQGRPILMGRTLICLGQVSQAHAVTRHYYHYKLGTDKVTASNAMTKTLWRMPTSPACRQACR